MPTHRNTLREQSKELRRSGVSKFLSTLHGLVNSPDTDKAIAWADEGASVSITKEHFLVLLPRHYNTSNYCSFKRQLYIYGFRSVRFNSEVQVYAHPCFRREAYMEILRIKRHCNKDEKAEWSTASLEYDKMKLKC